MPRSARFMAMQSELSNLRNQFLPAQFDPTGAYSVLVIAQARAYRVLAHAEVEHYLEDRAREVATNALTKWRNTGAVNRCLMALIAFSGKEMQSPPDTLAPSEPSATQRHEERLKITKRVDAASRTFFQCVKDNHGVKERNILQLFIPVGFDDADFDPVWLVTMNSFGEKRGEAAHLSAHHTVSHPPDPKSEFDLVMDVLGGIEIVDEKLSALMT